MRCWRCESTYEPEQTEDRFFCRDCGVIQPVEPGLSHFELLGFDAPACDGDALRERALILARRLHPDRFSTATEEERRISLVDSSAVHDAERCLADPERRARYWLELRDDGLSKGDKSVDPALAAELFEVQEMLADLRAGVRAGGRDAELVAAIDARRASLDERRRAAIDEAVALMDQWPSGDDAPARARLKERIAYAAYLGTVLRDIEDSESASWRESVA